MKYEDDYNIGLKIQCHDGRLLLARQNEFTPKYRNSNVKQRARALLPGPIFPAA